jgi:predicted transcriptional regulator
MNENEKLIIHAKHMIKTIKKPEYINLKQTSPDEYKQKLKDKYNQLFDRSISLFNMIIESENYFDIDKLINMLKLSNNVDNNKISYDKASEKWGQEQFDEYVKTNLKYAEKK